MIFHYDQDNFKFLKATLVLTYISDDCPDEPARSVRVWPKLNTS